jgi:hypothetical protein
MPKIPMVQNKPHAKPDHKIISIKPDNKNRPRIIFIPPPPKNKQVIQQVIHRPRMIFIPPPHIKSDTSTRVPTRVPTRVHTSKKIGVKFTPTKTIIPQQHLIPISTGVTINKHVSKPVNVSHKNSKNVYKVKK